MRGNLEIGEVQHRQTPVGCCDLHMGNDKHDKVEGNLSLVTVKNRVANYDNEDGFPPFCRV